MLIDCDSCRMRETDVCHDCVVSVLIADGGPLEIDESERRALDTLADAGLAPRLRLVPVDQPQRRATG